jgi:regulator of cell morphogenesis and NO signaling
MEINDSNALPKSGAKTSGQNLSTPSFTETEFLSLDASELISYILEKHHHYVEEKVPVLNYMLDQLYVKEGPENRTIENLHTLFKISSISLLNHLKKEENILFPHITAMVTALKKQQSIILPSFGSVDNPIAVLNQDHENEGQLFATISELTHQYTPPQDASDLQIATYSLLREFELNLKQHIHLEYHLLFPKAKELESCFTID